MKIRDRRFRCDLCGRYSDIGVTEHKPQAKRASVVCKGCIWKAGRMISDHEDALDVENGGFDDDEDEDEEDPSEVAGGDEGAPDNEVDPLGDEQVDEPGDENPELEDAETVETG